MKANSLALRLFVTAAAWVLVVLPIAGWIIYTNHRIQVEETFNDQIDRFLPTVIDIAEEKGARGPVAPSDQVKSFRKASAHAAWDLVWQFKPLDGKPLDGKPAEIMRARPLGDKTLPLPREHGIEPQEDETYWADLPDADGQLMRVRETIHQFGAGPDAQRYSVAVAGRLDDLKATVAAFRSQLIYSLALAGVGLLAATLFQVRFGLFPLTRMERALADIRSGKATRLEGDLPSEIKPLQNEINALLKSNQEIVERARTHVGNLAHALKTPLAVLINEARRDPSPLAQKVSEQADTMTGQVNLYLDRARMAARIGVIGRVTEVGPVAESLVRALDRLYRDKELAYSLDCPDDVRFLGERQDLEEMLGNLLDNASKWARSRVHVAAAAKPADQGNGAGPGWLEIRVEDDGPGLTPEQLAEPITRGRRLDETKPGSGLGHSIVSDLVYSYNGRFELTRADGGGLSARLTLPLAT
jgi:signal transduction histidine kinase